MRILFLTQIVPYPPDSGPKVKTWHVLRYLLDRGHEVTLATFVRKDEETHVETLRDILTEIHTVSINRSRIMDVRYWLQSTISGKSFLIERDNIRKMRTLVNQLSLSGSFNAIHADQLTMTQFALGLNNNDYDHCPRLIFDAHNAVWTIVERMKENSALFFKPMLTREARYIKHYEGMVVQNFDHTLAVTNIDKEALLQARDVYLDESKINTDLKHTAKTPMISNFPITVDTVQLKPIIRRPGSKNIVTLGTLHYPPNADGIRWFVQKVYPLVRYHVPDVKLTIIGKNPPKDLVEIASNDSLGITVTGYVQDLEPYLEAAALMVVPVRAGSGMRVRILEAFARSMPVVTTTVGLEGIEAKNGEDILVEDTSDRFGSAVVSLLNDDALQSVLAFNGRRAAQERYDWRTGLIGLDKIYQM